MKVTFIEHSGFMVEMEQNVLLFDYYPYIKAEDSKKSYPPYKYEIEMLKQEQFDPQMKEKILEDNQK